MRFTQSFILFFILVSSSSYAAWNAQCLDTCFSTGHECDYCAYQCEVEPSDKLTAIMSPPICPFIPGAPR